MVAVTSLYWSSSSAGTGKLVKAEGKIVNFRTTLEENLFQSARDVILGFRFTFQQDKCVEYTAKATVLQNSELNPNLWQDLEIAVHEWSTSNQTNLSNSAKKNGQNIRIYMYKPSQRHIPAAVIVAKGGYTKYIG